MSPPGAIEDLVFRRPKAKTALLERHKPLFDAIGASVPSDLLAPFDTAVDALWAEVDRLAPTFTFDAKVFHDSKAETGAGWLCPTGGGRYASTFKYAFGGIRYQQCK